MMRSKLRRMAGDSLWTMSGTGLTAVLGLVQVVVLTRWLGSDLYGQLVLVISVTMVIRQLLGVRIWEWAIKDLAAAWVDHDAPLGGQVVRTGYRLGLVVNLIAFAIVTATAPVTAARFIHDSAASWLVMAYGLTLLVSWSYDTSYAVLRVAGRFRFLAVQGVVFSLLRVSTISATVLIWARLDLTIAAYVLVELGQSLWLLAVSGRAFRAEFGRSWANASRDAAKRSRREMVRILAIGGVIDTLRLAASRADLLVLGAFQPPSVVAAYQAAWNFVDVFNRFTSPISMIVFSHVAKLAANKESSALVAQTRTLSLVILGAVLPVCAGLYLGADLIVGVVYGAQYHDAGLYLEILAWTPVWLAGLWLQPTAVSIGKPQWGLERVAFITVLKLAGLALLVPSYGAVGVAFANLAYFLVFAGLTPLYWFRTRRYVHSPEFLAPKEPKEGPASGA